MTRLAANSVILLASESISAALLMAVGLIVARGVEVAGFGRFTAAVAVTSVAAIGVDAGMGMLAAREIARGTPDDRADLNQIFSWRLDVMVLVWAVIPWVARFALPAGEIRRIAFWLAPGVLLIGLTDFFCWLFKGAQLAIWCAALQVTSRALLLGLSVVAVHSAAPVRRLVSAYAFAGAV